MSQHLWSAHLRSCSFSHHVMPAELISKFPDGSFFPHASSPRHCCALSQPGQQDLAPHGSLLLHQQSPSFSLSLSLPATWGNDSITYDLIHHLMMFGHSKAHLRPIKGSSHSLYSLFSASKTDPAGNVRVWFDQMRVCECVWTTPAALPHIPSLLSPWPVFGLFMSTCWESPEEASDVPGKTYGTAGMQTPAVGPVRAPSESLGIKGT